MSLGVCSLYALRYMAQTAFGPQYSGVPARIGALLLGAFTLYLVHLFARQATIDRTVLWSLASDPFRIGTWVAALNVLARLLSPTWLAAAWLCHAVAWVIWVMYIGWVLRIWSHEDVLSRLCGTAFLTTVATQSTVVAAVGLFPGMPPFAVAVLSLVNLLGIAFYCRFFLLVWVRRGLKAQADHWVPPNNITHGALSISVLAAESLAAGLVSPAAAIIVAIEAVWSLAVLLFVAVLVFEISLMVRGKADLLRLRVSNWARAFTFGMLFACTYYGASTFPETIMAAAASPHVLMALASLVIAVNAWEGGRLLSGFASRALQRNEYASG